MRWGAVEAGAWDGRDEREVALDADGDCDCAVGWAIAAVEEGRRRRLRKEGGG